MLIAIYLSYLKSKGVKMVFILDIVTNVFHQFAEYLYGNNMQVNIDIWKTWHYCPLKEQQDWEPGKYYLASLNFGGLTDSSSFQVNSHQSLDFEIVKYLRMSSWMTLLLE